MGFITSFPLSVKADEQKKKLESKLKAMESKLLSGGKNILDHTNEQHKELEQRRKLISEQNKKERVLQQDLEEKEEVSFIPFILIYAKASNNPDAITSNNASQVIYSNFF